MAGITNPSLYEYMQDTQLLIADTGQTFVNPLDLTRYINKARREVAMRSQSVRIVTPVSGAITSIEVINPGSGYINPQVIIDPPDAPSGELPYPGGAQAVASAQQIGGQISNVSIDFGGDGYLRPHARIVDEGGMGPATQHATCWEDGTAWEQTRTNWDAMVTPPMIEGTGEGAEVRVHTVLLTVTQENQEVYPFKNVPLDRFPGVAQIFAVKSVSFQYFNYRYSVPVFSFSNYQAYIRVYPFQYRYVPTAACQFGQGVNGSLYLYPVPSDKFAMEWDCFCLPQDLDDDQDYEAIPPPWTDAVPLFAAHLAYMGMQNLNSAQYLLDLYDNFVHRYSAYARPGRATNPYGRWAAFT